MLALAMPALCWSACNALDAPGPKGNVVLIPTDVRVAQLTAAPPPPISGGTLAVSANGKVAVAADPDRDRVSIVDLDTQLVQQIALESGDEPGRVVLDDSGRAYVALRHGAALAVVDLASGQLQQRLPVCAAPRGMVFDAEQRLVHVACMDGRLLSVGPVPQPTTDQQPSAAEQEIVRDVQVGLDLRDVMLRGKQLWVSSFKRVELMRLEADGHVAERVAPSDFALSEVTSFESPSMNHARVLQPHLAYRSISDASGHLLVLHQGESTEEVAIDQPDGNSAAQSPYGGGGACDGIVTPAITTIDAQGGIATVAARSGVLSVDMAVSSDNNMLAVVQAGATDPIAPQRQTIFNRDGFADAPTAIGQVSVPGFGATAPTPDGTMTTLNLFDRREPQQDCMFGTTVAVGGQSTAVAFRPRPQTSEPTLVNMDTDWLVQSREPARLTLVTMRAQGGFSASVIDLGGDSVRDTGHDLFHRDAGAGVACASCHAEGAEDGHVWNFTRLGLRRTQALHVGLEGTAPFHWAGDESDLSHLMSDVFVGRMGGVHQSDARVSALTRWLFALQPPAAPIAALADADAVERGHTLFMSPEVSCGSCHSGDKLTNNRTVDVGTGEPLQVPSLRGIAYRAPFMHNGCALTLHDRFSPTCGGAAHGHTSDLEPAQVDDLVAYLQTL